MPTTPRPATAPAPAPTASSDGKTKYDVYVVTQEATSAGDGVESDGRDGQRLARVARGIEAATREDACWLYSESPAGRNDALSDSPPKIVAIPSTGRAGIGEPKTYPLEQTVSRKRG